MSLSEESYRIIRDLAAQGYRQTEIAAAVGVSNTTVSKILNGKIKPRLRDPDAPVVEVDWSTLDQLEKRRKWRESPRKLTAAMARDIFLSEESTAAVARRYRIAWITAYRIRQRRQGYWRHATEGLQRPVA